MALIRLPAYEIPGNAMINLQPVNEGIAAYQKGAEQTRVAGALARGGNAMAAGDYGGAAQGFAEAGDPGAAIQAQNFGLNKQKTEQELQRQHIQDVAGMAQRVLGLPPEQRDAEWQKQLQAIPHLADTLTKSGVNPSDPTASAQFITDQVRGYINPTEQAKSEAQTALAKSQGLQAEAHARYFDAQSNQKTQGGYSDLHQRVEAERQLRGEFEKHPTVKDYQTVRDNYSKIQGAAERGTAAGDISMIFAYMKMLDPQSTVREGEFATAQNATGVPDRVMNLYNYVTSGNRLNPSQRTDFINEANSVYGTHERQYNAVRGQYETIAKNAQLDPRMVVTDLGKVNKGAEDAYGAGPQRPNGDPTMAPTLSPEQAMRQPPGTIFKTPDGRVMRVPQPR